MLHAIVFPLFILLQMSAVQSAGKLFSVPIKMPPSDLSATGGGGFTTDPFVGGGPELPAIRIDLRLKCSPTSDRVVVLQYDGLSRDREITLMRMRVIDLDAKDVIFEKIFELPNYADKEFSIPVLLGKHRSKFQINFQDSWIIKVNNVDRWQGGSIVTWKDSQVDVYRATEASVLHPEPKAKGKFKVD